MGIQWLIFVAAVIIIVQGIIYGKWGLKKIRYSRFFSTSAVFEGEEVQMVERISNEKLLPVPWLRVESKIDPHLQFYRQSNLEIKHGQFHKSLFSLMPYMQITRRHRIKCIKRGCYYLNSVALTCGDLFGVQEVSKELQVFARLLVYPRIVSLREIPVMSHSWQGDVTVRRWIVEDPFMISGVKEYRYGDPFNRINWKATARTGKIQVHNRDHTADPKLMIYLNVDISEHMWSAVTDPERIEKGISYAASIAQHAISRGIETGFGSNACLIDRRDEPVRVPPRCSRAHLIALLEIMAKLVIERSVTFFTFLEQDLKKGISGWDFLFITPFVSERMQEQIKRLRNLGNSVEILLIPANENEQVDRYES